MEKESLTVINMKNIVEDVELILKAISRGLSCEPYENIKLSKKLKVFPFDKGKTKNYLFNRVKSIELMYKSED